MTDEELSEKYAEARRRTKMAYERLQIAKRDFEDSQAREKELSIEFNKRQAATPTTPTHLTPTETTERG